MNRDVIDDSGSTPFVTASGVNNGVAAYIDASKYDIIKGDCILIGGKTFTLTYQKTILFQMIAITLCFIAKIAAMNLCTYLLSLS